MLTLPLLAVLSLTAAPATVAQSPNVVAAAPAAVDEVQVGSSSLMRLAERVELVVVADPDLVDAKAVSPTEVLVVGKRPGTTDVVFRLESGASVVRRVKVGLDAAGLETRLRELFSRSNGSETIAGLRKEMMATMEEHAGIYRSGEGLEKACATLAADCVNLVDKYDAGCVFLGVVKHVAHTRCADANKHFDKV